MGLSFDRLPLLLLLLLICSKLTEHFYDAFVLPTCQQSHVLLEDKLKSFQATSTIRPHRHHVIQNKKLRSSSKASSSRSTSSLHLAVVPPPASLVLTTTTITSNNEDLTVQLAIWIMAFSSSHIGMSAIRDTLIQRCGTIARQTKLIESTKDITLPKWWPGDDVGRDRIFPDEETAGRQLYRLGYTFISFFTLGGALSTYLAIQQQQHLNIPTVDSFTIPSLSSFFHMNGLNLVPFMTTTTVSDQPNTVMMIYLFVAASSFAASIASLFNASPLSLMPGFQKATRDSIELNERTEIQDQELTLKNPNRHHSGVIVGVLQRNDSLKFEPKGLTRITRHPLILPVVPWGIATSYLAGGHLSDFLLFSGLSIYAIAGCACQDLRILRKEGSVGTVFQPISSQDVGKKLNDFFEKTSFMPFGAVIDGRQRMDLVLKEFPYIPFLFGFPIGVCIEICLLQFVKS